MRRKPLGVFVALLLATILCATGAAASAPQAHAPSSGPATVVPAATRKIALGVTMLPYDNLARLDAFTLSTASAADADGHVPAIWSVWSDWGGANREFPTALLDGLQARGVVPMIIWEPAIPSKPYSPKYRYKRIIDGDHDAYIRRWARDAKDWGGRVILRFAHEMDGGWFPWGVARFDNTPARFVKAWRHIWKIFREERATNVKFLWSPYQPRKIQPWRPIYPGDHYVDYVGFTGFNWGTPKPWRSMEAVFKPAMTGLRNLTTRPVIVAEAGSSKDGGNKAAWIKQGYPAVYNAFPRIKAIVYFNVDTRNAGQEDWRLTRPQQALEAYKKILDQPRFQGKIP